MPPLHVPASDGHPLAADLYLPEGPPRSAVVLAPAMGVKRGFYAAFARYLADGGAAVVCADFRGIGGSRPPGGLRGFPATLRDWADGDLAGVLAWVRERWPDLPIQWFGHSIGGQLFGLVDEPPVERALLVASQSGYWRHWHGLPRLGMGALWHLIPVITTVAGKLPMRAFRQGEDVPAGVAREWAEWGRHPDYIFSVAGNRPRSGFETWRGSLRAYSFADDGYAPSPSVAALVDGFRTPDREHIHLAPADLGLPAIGHFGAFRPKMQEPLWAGWRDWLLALTSSAAARRSA